MKTAVEIYKLLPRTNCGSCGMPTCFGFATKVAAGLGSITACPNLTEAADAARRGRVRPKDLARNGL